ncbi:MAG: hypothetical protein HAW58_02415 [Candidatus Thioglobus sp.]|nr:hypothetical protein [Candidatus Thioglobus sp.]
MTLIVDLDRTLIDTDLLYKSSTGLAKIRPWLLLIYPFWLLRGKGYLKSEIAKRLELDIPALPYIQSTIDYIIQRKNSGDEIILATASHKNYALAVAKYLQLFDDVMASSKDFNLSGGNKADKLVKRFGKQNFDYIGDHARDLPVWECANLAILVNPSKRVIQKTQHLNTLILSTK